MALAFDTAATESDGISSGLSFPYTVAAVADSIIFIGVGHDTSTAVTITGLTYNGVSFGAAQWSDVTATVQFRGAGYLLALGTPDGSAHNVVLTLSGTADPVSACVQSWHGVNQSTPIRAVPAAVVEDGGNVNASIVVTGAQSGDVILSHIAAYNNGLTSGQTSRAELDSVEAGAFCVGTDSKTATGGDTITWTVAANGFWVLGALALVASAPGGRVTKNTRAFPLGMELGMYRGMSL